MTYKEFLNHFKEDKSDELCFKESRPEITDLIKNDIIVPDFYKDVAEMQGLEIFHGTHFVDKPKYDKHEQLICAVNGRLSFVMVPHVNRQEVYAGQVKDTMYEDKTLSERQ